MSHKALNQIKNALNAHESYVIYNDSIAGLEQKKQIAELETKYETEKKEQQIVTLTHEKELQEIKATQQKLHVLILLILVGLILIIGILLFRQNRIKAKGRETQIQQKLFRSQMNPHFIFNALGAIQNFIHSNQPDDATNFLSKFAQLMRNILEGSVYESIALDQELEIVNNYNVCPYIYLK